MTLTALTTGVIGPALRLTAGGGSGRMAECLRV
ncbi:MAG: hypothetical protein RLZZ522_2017 [Verrucomicrobiota bacterium]